MINIIPAPGYLLTRRYIPKVKSVFETDKETDGMDQKSEVLAVGDPIEDNNGIIRFPPCKKGDVIVHAFTNSVVEFGTDQYRFCHFTQVHGVWEDSK